jgi:hypothetical protein
MTGDALPNGNVLIVKDELGVAAALAQGLKNSSRQVQIVSSERELEVTEGIGLIVDLELLGKTGTALSSGALYKSIRSVNRWARYAGNVRAGYVLVAPRNEAGLGGLVRTLSREWQPRLVKGVEIVGDFTPTALAEDLAREILSSARDVEVRLQVQGPRQVAALHRMQIPALTPDFQGQVVAITGATSGIGKKLARKLAEQSRIGLALFGRRPAAEVLAFCEELRRMGARVSYHACDVRKADDVAQAIDAARVALGPIAFAIHSAGVTADGAFEEADDDGVAPRCPMIRSRA